MIIGIDIGSTTTKAVAVEEGKIINTIKTKAYDAVNARVINDGCNLSAPFMTMSFMSLSVIPHLKITPSGLFDVDTFNFTDLFI